MVNILYPELNKSSRHVSNYFDNVPASTSAVLGEEFSSAFNFGSQKLSTLGGYLYGRAFGDKILSREEYQQSEYFREGVEVSDAGIMEGVAQSIAESRDRKFIRDATLNRAKSGFGIGVARFSASMVGSVLDPTNLALGFAAPIAVGLNATARAAAIRAVGGITRNYGTVAGRVAAGAGEAALAGAAVEAAVILPAAYIEQDEEYGAFDAFVNVTAGAVLGGLVTGVGAKFSEVFKRANPETIEQAFRVSIADLASGRPVNVSAVLDTDPNISPSLNARKKVVEARRGLSDLTVKKPNPNQVPPALARAYRKNAKGETIKPKTLIQFVKDEGRIDPDSPMTGDLKARLDVGDFQVLKRGGIGLDEMARRAQEAGYFPSRLDEYGDRVSPEELVNALENDQYNNNTFSFKDPDTEEYNAAIELDERVSELGINPRGMTDDELFAEIDIRENALTTEEAAFLENSKGPGISKEQLDQEIARVQRLYTEQGDLEEFRHPMEEMDELAKINEVRLASEDTRLKAYDEELASLDAEIRAFRANDMLTDEDIAEIAEWDSVIERVEDMKDVLASTAFCVMRNGNV